MKTLTSALRHHLHFIIIVPLLIMVMTWPTFIRFFEPTTPPTTPDMAMKFWDAWYGKLVIGGQAEYYFTDRLFYPKGVSLAYHNFSLPHMLVFGVLQDILPSLNAYSLTTLLIILANTMAAYLYLLHLFRDKWIALAGAIVFGLNPYIINHPSHPDLSFVATIPLALYAFHRGITDRRMLWMMVSGALVGITAFIGMYIFICLLLTMGFYALFWASKFRRELHFWKGILLLLVVAGVISMLRVYPMLADAQILNNVLDKNSGNQRNADLLVFFVNPRHPLTEPVFSSGFNRAPPAIQSDGYLGILPLILISLGLLRAGSRRRMLPWLTAALFFAVLRLGSVLVIDGHTYSYALLPKYYLANLFPWIFKAFWDTSHFQIGIMLPWAALVCHSLSQIFKDFTPRKHVISVVIVLFLVEFEFYQDPNTRDTVVASPFQWIEWLGTEENQDSIRLINLPMGRIPSKRYGYFQALNGYPHVEGLSSRTPEGAYDYINQSFLLRSWRALKGTHCFHANPESYLASLHQLVADGFTHLVLHHEGVNLTTVLQSLADVPKSYEDEAVTIYRVSDLRQSCDSSAILSNGTQQGLNILSDKPFILSAEGVSVLSIHPKATMTGPLSDYYLTIMSSLNNLIPLNVDDLISIRAAHQKEQILDPNLAVAANSVILFAYNPRQSDAGLVDTYREWISPHFKFCSRLVDAEDTIIELFLLPDFPCNLAIADQPLAVLYDNGIQLGNLLPILNEDTLDLYLLWKRLPQDSHSFSIQFFDADGNKALGQDFVIGLEPLTHHRIDMSALEPGDYQVKLIVYNFETRASVSGTLISSDTWFDRELKFEQITVGS